MSRFKVQNGEPECFICLMNVILLLGFFIDIIFFQGTAEIRGIFLDMSNVDSMKLSADIFARMWNLKFLKFYNSHCSKWCENDCRLRFPKGLDCFPDELVYLHWQGYPLEYLPSNFNPKKLVYLNLRYSNIMQLCEDEKVQIQL